MTSRILAIAAVVVLFFGKFVLCAILFTLALIFNHFEHDND